MTELSLSTLALSLVTGGLAVFGLFLDRKHPKFKVQAGIFTVMVLVAGILQIVIGIDQNRKAEASIKNATDDRHKLLTMIDSLSVSSVKLTGFLGEKILKQVEVLRSFGLTIDRNDKKPLEEISLRDLLDWGVLEADEYRSTLLELHPPSQRLDRKTTVWYYTKEMDTPELRIALREVGFAVEDKKAMRNMADDLTNAVWHGPEVDLSDYKMVLTNLIRAHIDVQRIGPSCNNLDAKSGVIEVGASKRAAVAALPAVNLSQVKTAISFDDLDNTSC